MKEIKNKIAEFVGLAFIVGVNVIGFGLFFFMLSFTGVFFTWNYWIHLITTGSVIVFISFYILMYISPWRDR